MSFALRTCRDCGKKAKTIAELKNFINHKRGFMGKTNWCKDCASDYYKQYHKKERLPFVQGSVFAVAFDVQERWANSE